MGQLPEPVNGAMIFEDRYTYACLANNPKSKGHSVVVWKDDVKDLHELSSEEYQHLMNLVNKVRTAIMKSLDTEKVYLTYLDETEHVHWHLIPRYEDRGFTVLTREPRKLQKTELSGKIRNNLNTSNEE